MKAVGMGLAHGRVREFCFDDAGVLSMPGSEHCGRWRAEDFEFEGEGDGEGGQGGGRERFVGSVVTRHTGGRERIIDKWFTY